MQKGGELKNCPLEFKKRTIVLFKFYFLNSKRPSELASFLQVNGMIFPLMIQKGKCLSLHSKTKFLMFIKKKAGEGVSLVLSTKTIVLSLLRKN